MDGCEQGLWGGGGVPPSYLPKGYHPSQLAVPVQRTSLCRLESEVPESLLFLLLCSTVGKRQDRLQQVRRWCLGHRDKRLILVVGYGSKHKGSLKNVLDLAYRVKNKPGVQSMHNNRLVTHSYSCYHGSCTVDLFKHYSHQYMAASGQPCSIT